MIYSIHIAHVIVFCFRNAFILHSIMPSLFRFISIFLEFIQISLQCIFRCSLVFFLLIKKKLYNLETYNWNLVYIYITCALKINCQTVQTENIFDIYVNRKNRINNNVSYPLVLVKKLYLKDSTLFNSLENV